MDRRAGKTYDDGATETSEYDAAGRLDRFTTARGIVHPKFRS